MQMRLTPILRELQAFSFETRTVIINKIVGQYRDKRIDAHRAAYHPLVIMTAMYVSVLSPLNHGKIVVALARYLFRP